MNIEELRKFRLSPAVRRLSVQLLALGCMLPAAAQMQKIPFNGIIEDGAGKPVRTAHVYVRSPRDYALTDREGRFGLVDVRADDTLRIEVKKRLYVVPVANRKGMRIRLLDETIFSADDAPELVSLGYGFVSRRERTNATNYISGDELRRSGSHDIISALQGRVPGLDIVGRSSLIDRGSQQMSIRGTRTFTGNSTPAFVVDGVIVSSLEGINLNDVDYVEVMKEATVYGANGANGAILVHTKAAAGWR